MNNNLLQKQYVDLEKLRLEFLQYAPGYAQPEASDAFDKLFEMHTQKIINDGVYYIVLVDLAGSTKYSAKHGNIKSKRRIETFIKQSIDSLVEAKTKNKAIFLKEIGDAVLFVFQHFPDILSWLNILKVRLKVFGINDEGYILRTCVNTGEVCFQGVNPISLAVSQTFKMEKSVKAGDIGLTEAAFHIAWPTIARAYEGFTKLGKIELDGYKDGVHLYKLNLFDAEDLSRIVEENRITEYP